MTNVTTLSGMRANLASAANPPTSSSGAPVKSQRPSTRSSRLPLRTFSRMVSITDEVPSSGRDALAVPDSHHVVERVPFDRDLAGVTDDAEELLARESRRGFGARHVLDALVFEGAVHVVGAEVKGDRSRVLTEEHPVRLDVWKVVEQQARGRDRAEIVGGRRGPRHELRRPHLVRQRDERQEPARRVLLGSEPQQVIDPLRQRLDMAVEHRRVRPDAERMGDAVDLAPAVAVGLARVAEELGHPRREDLGAAARHRLEPGGLEARQGLRRLDLPAPPEVVDLGGGEGLDLNRGARGVQPGDHALVVLERPIRVVTTDDVDLANLVAHHAHDVLDRVLEGPRFAFLPREAAKGAGENADVRRRDVAVEDEIDALALALGLGVIGHAPEAEQVLGLEEREAVAPVEPFSLLNLLPDGLEPAVKEAQDGGLRGGVGSVLATGGPAGQPDSSPLSTGVSRI